MNARGLFAALFLMVTMENAFAQDNFSGAYVLAGLTSENVWGGSLVAGVDVLAQDRRLVKEVGAGWMLGFGDSWAAGVEMRFGWLDGDLETGAPTDPLYVTYANDRQFSIGLLAGRKLAERHLAYVYAHETTREFDVVVAASGSSFVQRDEQGALHYGVGLATSWTSHIETRVSLGTYRVDFGGRPTNIQIDAEVDLRFEVVYRF